MKLQSYKRPRNLPEKPSNMTQASKFQAYNFHRKHQRQNTSLIFGTESWPIGTFQKPSSLFQSFQNNDESFVGKTLKFH
jgi:hypothetical protein